MATPPAAALNLSAGDLRLALRPDLGACMAGLWLGELPVLASADPVALSAARPSGGFPLVPYSNRIGFRRFRWQGIEYTTEANSGVSPHSMHGVAWQRPWEVISVTADSADMRYRHAADSGWPFAFEVVQRFELSPNSLSLQLRFTSTDAHDQPVGLGWHPYFHRRAGSHLTVSVTGRWASDDDGLPVERVEHAGIVSPVSALRLDHCFEGWPGRADLRDESLRVVLTSSLSRLVVYTPHDKDFFCVEPVSHVNNAIQMPDPLAHGLRQVAPGETLEAWMKLDIQRA